MSETYLTNHIGWLQEATYGTDPNPNSNPNYHLGKPTGPMGNLPRVKQEIQVNHFNSYAPGEIVRTKQVVDDNLNFEPVNCLPWKYMFQKIDGTGITDDGGGNQTDGIRTVAPGAITPSEQRASWTFRTDTGNSSENIREHILGNRMTRLMETFNFIAGSDARLQSAISYIGKKRATPATDVSNPPIYPQSISKSYKKATSTVLTWDGDSMLPQVVQFSWFVQNEFASNPVDNQQYIEEATTGNQTYGFVLNVRRAGGFPINIKTDQVDQIENNGSKNDMIFKIFNDDVNDLYKQITFSTCTITDIVLNHVIDQNFQQVPTFAVLYTPLSITPVFKDGLNKATFYNI